MTYYVLEVTTCVFPLHLITVATVTCFTHGAFYASRGQLFFKFAFGAAARRVVPKASATTNLTFLVHRNLRQPF